MHGTHFLLPQRLHSTLVSARSPLPPKRWGFPSWFLTDWVSPVSFLHTWELGLRRFQVCLDHFWENLQPQCVRLCFLFSAWEARGQELPRSQKNRAFWIFKSCCACDSGSQEQTRYYLQVRPQAYFCSSVYLLTSWSMFLIPRAYVWSLRDWKITNPTSI